ncbi:hypothetical protein Q0O53_13740, partial [Staphylococcus aureus]|nr:hypothetical protein [Staphylococcus aureus]
GSYLGMAGFFVIPSIFMAVSVQVRYLFKVFFLFFFLVFYHLFSRGNGIGGNFTWDRYRNVLWSS